MTSTTKPKPKKRARRIVHFRVERLVRIETGEEVGAPVPLTRWDARAMRDRKYHTGSELRADLSKKRNPMFWRLAHAMAAMVIDQIDDFANLAVHDALKKLQADSGAACEIVEYDIPELGHVTRSEPRSLSFDECDEGEFSEVMSTIYRHIGKKYWPSMDEFAIEEMVAMYERNG